MCEEHWNNAVGKAVRKGRRDLFDRTVLPCLNSAYNLAHLLTRNQHDAEDIVQEAFLRALRSFDSFVPGRDGRAWLLAIVRNCFRSWLKRNRSNAATLPLNDESPAVVGTWSDPEAELIKTANSQVIGKALEELPLEYREILILRELEDLSYKEIAQIIEKPLGTVMSRLSRARRELYGRLAGGTTERVI
ncbi:MAG: sigma-70 family RNA polymerase sigma factor [Acidobacteriaceae bacterium]|nr:sigma-70 family RNA polymerase sigma factor [Acidobacteriaceae bacterium]